MMVLAKFSVPSFCEIPPGPLRPEFAEKVLFVTVRGPLLKIAPPLPVSALVPAMLAEKVLFVTVSVGVGATVQTGRSSGDVAFAAIVMPIESRMLNGRSALGLDGRPELRAESSAQAQISAKAKNASNPTPRILSLNR